MPLIYCVEDDENIRELVGYALRSQDFEVETFADSKEFWPALEKRTPALLLLDIMLPGESGNDILEKLRKTQPYKTLPVIMLTAKTAAPTITSANPSASSSSFPVSALSCAVRAGRIRKRISIRMGRFPWTRKSMSSPSRASRVT